MAEEYAGHILPALERVMDAFGDSMEVEIDHLELDLGTVALTDFVETVAELAGKALEEQLLGLLGGGTGASPVNPRGVRRLSLAQGRWEALGHYLLHGHAPWWVVEGDFKPWEILVEFAEGEPAQTAAWLRRLGLETGGTSALAHVMARIAGAQNPQALEATLAALLGSAVARASLEWLQTAAALLAGSSLWELRRALLVAAACHPDADVAFFERWLSPSRETLRMSGAFRALLAPSGSLPSAVSHAGLAWLDGTSGPGGDSPRPLHSSTPWVPIGAGEQELWVANAGLALVAGFLPSYFEHLELLAGAGFRDEAAQRRAVRLLEVLARGLHAVEEHELALNKVLCGMDVAAPLDMSFAPSATDLEAADSLLQAVIGHWPVVGDIAPDQLRGGFLMREGWLTQGQQDWRLRVERRGYDVALERLPWTIGVIALPWLDCKVWVEW